MRYAVALGAVVLAAVVSGCSAGDAAPAEVGPLASASASAAASGAASDRLTTPASQATGDAARDDDGDTHPSTVAGASAFAQKYVEAIGQGFSQGDSRTLRRLSAPGCEGCEALIRAMDEAAADGLRRRGGEYEVSSVATPPFEGGDVVLLLTYTRAPSDIVDASGTIVERVDAVPTTTVQMRLVFGTSGWLTQGYRIV